MSRLTGDKVLPLASSDAPRTLGVGHWTPRAFRIANIAGASLSVIFAASILLGSQGYAFAVGNQPGPGMYPTVVGVGLLGLSIAWLVGSILGRYAPDEEVEPPPDRSAFLRGIASFLVVGVSAFTMQPLGYPITAALAVFVLTRLGGGRWRAAVFAGLLFAVVSFLLVTTVLGVQLPTGVLRPLLIDFL